MKQKQPLFDVTLGEGFNTQVVTLWCFNIVLP